MEADRSWLRDPQAIKAKLKAIAASLISYAVALIVATEYREIVGNVDIMAKACHDKSVDELVHLIGTRVDTERLRIDSALDRRDVEVSVRREFGRLAEAIEGDSEQWKEIIPGKQLLSQFAASTPLDVGRLKRLYIQEALKRSPSPFEEIFRIFSDFDAKSI